jgi:hypothetical protein
VKAKLDGRCLVSGDLKMAVSVASRGAFLVADLVGGQVVKVELDRLVKGGDLGALMSVEFSQDMKYICFCTSTKLFVFSLGKMKLEKIVEERRGFVAVASSEDGQITAVAATGKILTFSNELVKVRETKCENHFDLFDVDPAGKQIIFASSEEYNAEVFDVQQNKVITTIVGE